VIIIIINRLSGGTHLRLTFLGAARFVTGSQYLLEAAGMKILIDSGLAQGKDEKKAGDTFSFNPAVIDAVILTHAHIDHSGRIPQLVKEGFKGPIYATEATKNLCSIMLLDSAHIQESEAEWANRKAERSGKPKVEPLYTKDDAYASLDLFEGLEYEHLYTINEGVSFRFVDAGHLLGSSSIEIFIKEGGEEKKLVFSGDIGNLNQPIIKDPSYLNTADVVIMESTYGDRLHEKKGTDDIYERARLLAEITDRTFKRGGKLIIPSFAVGRTQEILYLYRLIMDKKYLPYEVPVFLDSPLAVRATSVFKNSIRGDYFDDEAMDLVNKGINPVDFPSLVKTQDVQDSMALNFRKESCVIISSSGMCDAGRIKHHLKHNLWKKESTVLFVGYQASGTLGRSLADGAEHVTIFGEQIDVRAEIASLPGLSGHADRVGLLKWINSFSEKPEKVFITHGDENVAQLFASDLVKMGFEAYAPQLYESFDLDEALPVDRSFIIIDENKKTLSEAQSVLSEKKAALDSVIKRLSDAAEGIDYEDEKRVKRLSNAISRFASDLDFLFDKWNGDAK